MKKRFTAYLTLILVYCFSLSSEIVETPHFSQLLEHVSPKTLVILDIDDTLLIPSQALGTDVWFIHRWNEYKKANIPADIALEKALNDWQGIRHITDVKIVEEGTDSIVKTIQDQNITVMGLTTQGLALATCTILQLDSLHIDLSKTAPYNQDYYFMNGKGVLFRHGILFTAGTNKGKALLHLLDHINYKPDHIVFINDKASHLNDLGLALAERNIKFTGLRYAYSDARVNAFDPEIADIQWKKSSFDHILTDEEAASYLVH